MKLDTVNIAQPFQASLTTHLSKIMKSKLLQCKNLKMRLTFFEKLPLGKSLKINTSTFKFQLKSSILDTLFLQNGGLFGVTTSILSLSRLMKSTNEGFFIIRRIFLRIKTYAQI